MPTRCGTVTSRRPQTSTACLCCRYFCPAVRPFARRRAPRQRSFSRTWDAGVSFTSWRANTSRWPNNFCIRPVHHSWRSEVCRAQASRRWRSVSRPSSAPCLVRSSSAATRRGSVCAMSRSWSALVPKDILRRCRLVSTRRWLEQAGVSVREGHCAIVDAVYGRPADRLVIERAAAEASVPFVGLWLDAPESTLIARAESAPERSIGRGCRRHPRRSERNRQELSAGIGWTPRCRPSSCCSLASPA